MRFNPHSLIRLIRKSLAVFLIEGLRVANEQPTNRSMRGVEMDSITRCAVEVLSDRWINTDPQIYDLTSEIRAQCCRAMFYALADRVVSRNECASIERAIFHTSFSR